MKKILCFGMVLFLFHLVFTFYNNHCFGEIYKYKDKDGVWCFTNDHTIVPDLSKAKIEKECCYYEPKKTLREDSQNLLLKKIKQVENRLEVIQKDIDRVITWRTRKLGSLHLTRSFITSRTLHAVSMKDEENINAEATKQLDKLRNERDFLQNKLLLLQDKILFSND
jgi:hypothetical protein